MEFAFQQQTDVMQRRALCFTGHRPEKLPTGKLLSLLIETLHYHIDDVIARGFRCFYVGLADGVDYYAAEYLFSLRRKYPDIRVVGVQPCEDYEEFFLRRGYSFIRLRYMLGSIDKLVILPGTYRDSQSFLRRNRYMVERSRALIAVCGSGRSGSQSTLVYARNQGLACRQIIVDSELPVTEYLGLRPETWPVQETGVLTALTLNA